jgi:hypothetical protein
MGGFGRASPSQEQLLSSSSLPALRHALAQAIAGPAPDGGVWTGPRLAAWMAERLSRPVDPLIIHPP